MFVKSIEVKDLTCKDCDRFKNDDACLTAAPDDSIVHSGFDGQGKPYSQICSGFQDKLYTDFRKICTELDSRNCNVRKVIDYWYEDFCENRKLPND